MKFVNLKDLCLKVIDCPHSTPKWEKSGVTVIRNFNLVDGFIDLTDHYFVSEETYKERTKRAKPEPYDIIISREAPIGVVGIVPPGLKCCLGQRLVLLKINKDIVNPFYVLYALMSDYVQQQIKRADATGSIVSNLCIPDLEKLKIPFDENVQEKAGNILAKIDDAITKDREILSNYEKILFKMYDYWFTQNNFPNSNGKPYAQDNGELAIGTDGILFPKNWQFKKLIEVLTFEKGVEVGSEEYKKKKSKEDIEFYRVSDLNTISQNYVEKKLVGNRILTENDVVVSLDGTVGKVDFGINGAYSSGVRKVFDKKGLIHSSLIYCYLKSEYAQKMIRKYTTGSNILHASECLNHMFIKFDEKTIKLFQKTTDKIFNQLLSIKKEIKEYILFKNFLLDLFMSGKLI